MREFGIIAVLALLVLVTAIIEPRFVDLTNIQFILVDTTIFALLALGETMVVLTRNVDLSIGSVLGLSAFLSADLFGSHPGIPIPLVFLVGLAIGVACGTAIGFIVVVGRVPSLVVTLAALYMIRGIDVLLVGGGQVVASSLPNAFIDIPKKTFLGVPVLAIVIALVIAVAAYYLRSFRSGRDLYAIGSNPDAARLAGIPAGRRVWVAFIISGAVAGLAGVLYAARYGTIDSTAGGRLRAAGDRGGRRRRRGHLRRQRERRRRGVRRAPPAVDPVCPVRPRRLAVLEPGDRRRAAARSHRARPRHLAPARIDAAQTEDAPWRLSSGSGCTTRSAGRSASSARSSPSSCSASSRRRSS